MFFSGFSSTLVFFFWLLDLWWYSASGCRAGLGLFYLSLIPEPGDVLLKANGKKAVETVSASPTLNLVYIPLAKANYMVKQKLLGKGK